MLVLSRKKNETIVIDGRIKVEVLKIKGNTIRLGISAPSNVKVLRGELAPREVETGIANESTGQTAAEDKPKYQNKPSSFSTATEELSELSNPFAVFAG